MNGCRAQITFVGVFRSSEKLAEEKMLKLVWKNDQSLE